MRRSSPPSPPPSSPSSYKRNYRMSLKFQTKELIKSVNDICKKNPDLISKIRKKSESFLKQEQISWIRYKKYTNLNSSNRKKRLDTTGIMLCKKAMESYVHASSESKKIASLDFLFYIMYIYEDCLKVSDNRKKHCYVCDSSINACAEMCKQTSQNLKFAVIENINISSHLRQYLYETEIAPTHFGYILLYKMYDQLYHCINTPGGDEGLSILSALLIIILVRFAELSKS